MSTDIARWGSDVCRRCNNHGSLSYYCWELSNGLWNSGYRLRLIKAMSQRCSEANLTMWFRCKWDNNRRDLSNTVDRRVNGWCLKTHCWIFGFVGVNHFESVIIDCIFIVDDDIVLVGCPDI